MRQEALMKWANKQTSKGRKDFEKFIMSKYKNSPPGLLNKTDNGRDYAALTVQLAWEAWKASRKAIRSK